MKHTVTVEIKSKYSTATTAIAVSNAKINRKDNRSEKYEWIKRATAIDIAKKQFCKVNGIAENEVGNSYTFKANI